MVLAAFVSLHRSQVAIRVGHADRETITASIATNGKIEALEQLSGLRSHRHHGEEDLRAAGYLGESPDRLLLRLDDADARLQAARAEAQLKGAEVDVNAVQSGGTPEELLNTRNALVKAQADRDVAERNYQAMQSLLQTGAASQAEVDAAKNRLRSPIPMCTCCSRS